MNLENETSLLLAYLNSEKQRAKSPEYAKLMKRFVLTVERLREAAKTRKQ